MQCMDCGCSQDVGEPLRLVEQNAAQTNSDVIRSMSDLTLRQELLQADAAFAEVLEMSGQESQKKIRDVLALLQSVQVHARRAGVISPDEEAREVSGKNLEFVLLNWNVAQLLSRCILETDGSREAFEASIIARKSYISRAILCIEAFIVQMQQLRLISAEDEKTLHFDPANASARRERKISLFRKIKAAKEQLEHAKAIHERLVQLRAAPKIWSGSAASSAAAAVEDGDDDWEEEGDAEEAHRNFILAKIHFSMLEAIDSYGGLKDEMELLDSRPTEVLGSASSGASACPSQTFVPLARCLTRSCTCRAKDACAWMQWGQGHNVYLALGQVIPLFMLISPPFNVFFRDRVRASAFMPTNLPTM